MFYFQDYSKLVKNLSPRAVRTENLVFTLCCRLTVWFILACALVVSSKQFIKNHIECIAPKEIAPVVGTFCFFMSTYTVPKYHNSSMLRAGAAIHPGVGPYDGKGEIIRHTYYQWVPFVLILQALMFYGPRKLWKHLDNNRLFKTVEALNSSKLISDEDKTVAGVKISSAKTRSEQIKLFSKSYLSMTRFKANREWAVQLVFCEVLNVVNLIFQFWITDALLRGNFLRLGSVWWSGDKDSLDSIFPKVTKCTFHKYGPSGSIQDHDTVCVMSLNIINEKVYVILWFWFASLFILTLLALFWRLLTFTFHNSRGFNKFIWSQISPGPIINPDDVEIVTENLHFPDWLFLHYVGQNVASKLFRETVANIAKELSEDKKPLVKLTSSDALAESDC